MTESKICVTCLTIIFRPKGYSDKKWESRQFCSNSCRGGGEYAPCRICGNPTKYQLSKSNKTYYLVRCESEGCKAESKRLKNENISQKAKEMYDAGQRVACKDGWKGVKRISPEEEDLNPFLEPLGWVPQHIVLTGVHTNKLPRMFRLDFALPDKKIYVEIDGSVHRLREFVDLRRDQMLTDLGWVGLRIPSLEVKQDIQKVIAKIKVFGS